MGFSGNPKHQKTNFGACDLGFYSFIKPSDATDLLFYFDVSLPRPLPICNLSKEVILLTLFNQLTAWHLNGSMLYDQTGQVLFKFQTFPADIVLVLQIFWGGKHIGQK